MIEKSISDCRGSYDCATDTGIALLNSVNNNFKKEFTTLPILKRGEK